MNKSPQTNRYTSLKKEISQLLIAGREQAGRAVNTILVQTYSHIVDFEQGGEVKSEYGSNLLDRLSRDLILEFGKGFSRSNLVYMRKLFISFPISETLSHKLSWSHYFEILKSDDSLEVSFYFKQCENENWSVRELKRQIKSMLFHRLALSKDKEQILQLSQKGAELQHPKDLIKDPYVFEFLGLSNQKITNVERHFTNN